MLCRMAMKSPGFLFYLQATGSCAGASSSEFDIYRNARRRENERVEYIERMDEAARLAKDFNDRVSENKKEADAKTAKNAAKRQKKKDKKKALKAAGAPDTCEEKKDEP